MNLWAVYIVAARKYLYQATCRSPAKVMHVIVDGSIGLYMYYLAIGESTVKDSLTVPRIDDLTD